MSLYGTDGHPLNGSTVAYTLAVALRRAIAAHLGIDETELGCDTKEIRDSNGQRVRSLQIFDVRSAGYSSLVAPDLPALLKKARENLICEHDCDGACQRCLLSFDTRFRASSLDRKAALEFLTQEWVDSLALPEPEWMFGPTSQAEYQPVDEAITRELNRSNARRLYVYLNGTPDEWDLPTSPLKSLLHRLSVKSEVELCLVSTVDDLTALSAPNTAILRSLQAVCAVDIKVGAPPLLERYGFCMATVETHDGACRTWAFQEPGTSRPDACWGQPSSRPLVVSTSARPKTTTQPILMQSENARGGRTVR